MKRFMFFFRAVIIFLIIHILFMLLGAYNYFSWLDIPMHFLGGAIVAYTATLFLKHLKKDHQIEIYEKWISLIVIVSFVALIAVFWEFLEFFLKEFFGANTQPSIGDTMADFFFGIVGAVVGWFAYGR